MAYYRNKDLRKKAIYRNELHEDHIPCTKNGYKLSYTKRELEGKVLKCHRDGHMEHSSDVFCIQGFWYDIKSLDSEMVTFIDQKGDEHDWDLYDVGEYFYPINKPKSPKRETENWKKVISPKKWLRCVEDENCVVIDSLKGVYYNPYTDFIYRIIKNCNDEETYIRVDLTKVDLLKDEGVSDYYNDIVTKFYNEKIKEATLQSCNSKEGDSELFDELKESLEEMHKNSEPYAIEVKKERDNDEYTGGSVNYYKLCVNNPTTATEPYEAECNDIIEALDMNYAEGNAFKAIWRKCAARKFGVQKKGYDNGLYDSEKVVFFGERMIVQSRGED